jgi:hypothetical protein
VVVAPKYCVVCAPTVMLPLILTPVCYCMVNNGLSTTVVIVPATVTAYVYGTTSYALMLNDAVELL